MLGYRHAFHAGNHADVLKHLVLIQLLEHLCAKDKAFWYIDTHAGAGRYALHTGFAAAQREFDQGVARLWEMNDTPQAIVRYLEIVRSLNPGGKLRHYPGSPWIAQSIVRPQDQLWLHELHPADHRLLERSFADCRRHHIHIDCSDGLAALKALLPPQPRRALVVIDPSYEMKSDYSAVVSAVREALRRFPTGVYMVWHPLLTRRESRDLPGRLANLGGRSWLHATLAPRAPGEHNGLYGSGVFVINPPFTLEARLREALPVLAERLALDKHAGFTLECGP